MGKEQLVRNSEFERKRDQFIEAIKQGLRAGYLLPHHEPNVDFRKPTLGPLCGGLGNSQKAIWRWDYGGIGIIERGSCQTLLE